MKFDYEANKHLVCTPQGRRVTTGLFEEFERDGSGFAPPFSIREWRRIYVDIADPSDYEAAMALIGDWEHWLLLLDSPMFAKEVAKWRQEVEVKLRSEGIARLVKHAKGPQGTAAAKWLAEAGFVPHRDKRKKQEKQTDEAMMKEAKSKVAEDAERLGIRVVK